MVVIRNPLSTKKNSSGTHAPCIAVAPAWKATTGTIRSARTPVSAGRLPNENGLAPVVGAGRSASVVPTGTSEPLEVTAVLLASRSSLIGHIMSQPWLYRCLAAHAPGQLQWRRFRLHLVGERRQMVSIP